MTVEALKGIEGVTPREAERSKNFFALGLMSWLYGRPIEVTLEFIDAKFAKRPEIAEANTPRLQGGLQLRRDERGLRRLRTRCGRRSSRRACTGRSRATRRSRSGWSPPASRAELPLFLGAYPITPASGILEELARYKQFGVRTFQAEDEIAAAGAALGASFGGALGVCTSAGPGVVLKAETVGLAVTLELPLLVIDVQRAGPSTGMPTKPEQADLLMVLFGRNSESPVPVLAASTPGDCFDMALEAARIALKYRTPVYLLSDAYLANGAEPWLIPDATALPDISVEFATAAERRRRRLPPVPARPGDARPAVGDSRDARPRAPHRRPREGGRHRQHLLRPRQPRPRWCGCARRRWPGSPRTSPSSRSTTPTARELLVLGWGGTYGPIAAAVRRVRDGGGKVAQAHLHYLNPFPRNTGEVLRSYERVLVPEMNLGQLAEADASRVPRRRRRLQPCARRPVPLERARRRDRGDAMRARFSREVPLMAGNGKGNGMLALTAKDFKSDQEVRWCPGCGDYAILAAVQAFMPELGIPRERDRLRLRHRLRGPLPVLHADLRDALDPRPCARDRDRARHARGPTCPSGS